jgi:NAD(P)-dependent dehydrogenase (short-subunit alcohol dehydrogenase family)
MKTESLPPANLDFPHAMRMQPLRDKIAFVTGGGRGLGAAICNALAAAGATVVVADINFENAHAVAREVGKAGGQAHALQVDIGAEEQVQQAIAETLSSYGRLDALINNAGIDFTLPIDELSVEQWDAVVRTNLRGPFLLCKYASPVMRRHGSGHIINIASTAAKRAWPNASAYHASKWALLGLSHALHAELRPHGIKVSAVIAGGMRTPFLLDRFPDLDPGVLQDPANVAATVCFLLTQPAETVIPEVMVLPMRETSWP